MLELIYSSEHLRKVQIMCVIKPINFSIFETVSASGNDERGKERERPTNFPIMRCCCSLREGERRRRRRRRRRGRQRRWGQGKIFCRQRRVAMPDSLNGYVRGQEV
jgi:hypothetical protein